LAAAAQSPTGGSIVGQVTDQQGAGLPGVGVTIIGAAVPLVRRVTTDRTGRYRFSHLEPDRYTLAVEGQGFTRVERPDVVVREGMQVTVPLTLPVGTLTDVVTVQADTPLIDLTSAGQTVNVRGELQRSLPLTSLGTWSDFLLLAPGVATTQARAQTYTLHGATHASGVYLVDGANAASVLQGSTLYSQFAGATFNDIQIRTGGFDAASPLGFGPVVTISTQSGTNHWRGTAAFEFQSRAWNGHNAPGGQTSTVAVNQQDFSIGGPLVSDRLWMFASGRVPERVRQTVVHVDAVVRDPVGV
jgi:hypothetical protein